MRPHSRQSHLRRQLVVAHTSRWEFFGNPRTPQNTHTTLQQTSVGTSWCITYWDLNFSRMRTCHALQASHQPPCYHHIRIVPTGFQRTQSGIVWRGGSFCGLFFDAPLVVGFTSRESMARGRTSQVLLATFALARSSRLQP